MSEILTSARVEEIGLDCMFESTPPPADGRFVVVLAIMHGYLFNGDKLEEHQDEIHRMLLELPQSFHQNDGTGEGGGWSFLNMCMTKDGQMWTGEQGRMELLMALAIGCGWGVAIGLPHTALALFMPGGMPYFIVLPERKEMEFTSAEEIAEMYAKHEAHKANDAV